VVTNIVEGKATVSNTVEVTVGLRKYETQKAVALLIFRTSTTSSISVQLFEGLRRWRLESSIGEAVVHEMARARAAIIQLRRHIFQSTLCTCRKNGYA
jgi:hypothetical protein